MLYTISVLISLLQMSAKLSDSLKEAEQYLINKINNPGIQTDPYTLAVIGYALSLAENKQVQTVFDTLKTLSTNEGMCYISF